MEAHIAEMTNKGWKELDLNEYDLILNENIREEAFMLFKQRESDVLNTFCLFFSDSLITSIWNDGSWIYNDGWKLNGEKLSLAIIYQFLAVVVWITGLNDRKRLRSSIKDSLDSFAQRYGKTPNHRGINIENYFPQLSINFQSVVRSLGQTVAGDEKLYYYTGECGDVRKCPNKPAKLGLWFYELAGCLQNKSAFILHIKMAKIHNQLGEAEKMADIVSEWADVVTRKT